MASHPLRWRILGELARSDLRVRELTDALTRPQNLVSYHLARLRTSGLVTARRSSADGRDAYYRLDLERCQQLLAATGCALHPGLVLAEPRTPKIPRGTRVLFLCTGNSARSQIAEALVNELDAGARAFSAGSHPKPLHPNAVRVMRERGIDLSECRSKSLQAFSGRRFDHVVTLCDRVREVCPEFPDHPRQAHWSIPDPAREGSGDEETYPAFERTTRELEVRLRFFVHVLALRPESTKVN